MAVDTRQKLFSLLRLHKPYTVNTPDPILSFTQGDLQQFVNGYSGILWASIATIPGKLCFSAAMRMPTIEAELVECPK